jgi:hypothetical protein
MSLDNFFDTMQTLNKRRLVHMPCTFVKTEKVTSIILPVEYKPLVQRYYPDCDIIDGQVEIVVVKDER